MVIYDSKSMEGVSVITEEGRYVFGTSMLKSDFFTGARPVDSVAAINFGVPYTLVRGAMELGDVDRAKCLARKYGTIIAPGTSLVIFFKDEMKIGSITGVIQEGNFPETMSFDEQKRQMPIKNRISSLR